MRQAPAPGPETPAELPTVLVVDDTPIHHRLADRICKGRYRIVHADSGSEALERIAERLPDAVVLDINMPEMDGLEACRAIREKHDGFELPVLFATGATDDTTLVRAFEAGGNDFLRRPFEPVELLARLGTLLAAGHAHRQLLSERQQLEHYRVVLDNSTDMIIVTDEESRIAYATPAAERVTGYPLGELIGRTFSELFAPSGPSKDTKRLKPSDTWSPGAARVFEVPLRRKDGQTRILELRANNRMNEAPIRGLVINCSDVTERREMEAALRASEERYALAARGANDGLWEWDPSAGRAYFSERWCAMLGLEEKEHRGSLDWWLDRVHAEDRERIKDSLIDHVEGRAFAFECEYRILHADGSHRWMLSRASATRESTGRALKIAGWQSDVTSQRAFDALTGLPNRLLFLERLRHALENGWHSKHDELAVLLIDPDDLSHINDSFGQFVGDQVLVRLARILRSHLLGSHTVARIVGDVFAVLVHPVADRRSVGQLCETIEEALAEPLEIDGLELYVTATIGTAFGRPNEVAAEQLVHNAEIAVHRAKALGKGRCQVFDESMRAGAIERLKTETDLRHAVQRQQFELFYQPIVELSTGELAGAEALIRWHHPERGLVPPGLFIPIAEESELIIPISRWVLRTACRQAVEWQARMGERDFFVAVNLSSKHFREPDIAREVAEVLAETGLRPERLKIEITESMILSSDDETFDKLKALRSLGVRLCMDDFGTGYSSLSYLHRVPINTLKIDRSFVSHPDTQGAQGLVPTIVAMARSMDLELVAEGVETAAQASWLHELGCQLGQGYFFAKPVPGGEAEAWLEAAPNGWSMHLAGLAAANG